MDQASTPRTAKDAGRAGENPVGGPRQTKQPDAGLAADGSRPPGRSKFSDMSTPDDNPCPPEGKDFSDPVWGDGFAAGQRAAYSEVLDLMSQAGCSAAQLHGVGMVPDQESGSSRRLPSFPSLQAYYDADPVRRHSGEADYGVHWRLTGWPAFFRVSYVQATGEVYGVHDRGEVLLLGVVPPDTLETGQIYYRTLDQLLEGWPVRCGRADGLSWVISRLRAGEISRGGVR